MANKMGTTCGSSGGGATGRYMIFMPKTLIFFFLSSLASLAIHFKPSFNTDRTDRPKGDPYNGRITAKHQYTCTKGTQVDFFLPRDAAEKIWSFWNRHQSPKSPFPSKCLVPGFLAHWRAFAD